MAPLRSSVDIGRPPDEVFAYVTDPARFADWQSDVRSAHALGEGPPTVGSRLTTVRKMGPREGTMTQEITGIDPPRTWKVRGVDGPLRPSMSILVEPVNGDQHSRVTFSLDFEGHGVGALLVPIVRRMASKSAPVSYRRLKTILESGESRTG